MSDLPRPVRRVLRNLDAAALDRSWAVVRARPSRIVTVARGAGVLMVCVAAAILLLVWKRPHHGPLRVDSGRDIATLSATDAAVEQRFEDGSRVVLATGGELRVVDNSERTFTTLLVAGRIDVEVEPGGPRTWVIECGLATVEVVGTRFTVERDERSVHIAVTRGAVVVRSERLQPDRIRRVAAGEEVLVEREAALTDAPAVSSLVAVVPSATAPSSSVTLPSAVSRGPWRELAAQRDFAGAYRALGPGGIVTETSGASVDELFTLADVARLSGHPADAVAPLRRVAVAGGRGAALASFTLAKLELDALGRSAEAANDLTRALALGLPGALVEDAHARRVEALGRSGQREAATQAARAFATSFPDSPRRAEIERWLAP